MIYVLFISILLLATIEYHLMNKDILSPSFWASIMFAFSVFINVMNTYRWGTSYSIKAYSAIIIGLISIFIGEYFYRNLMKRDFRFSEQTTQHDVIDVDTIRLSLIIIVELAILFFQFRYTKRVGGGLTDFLQASKNAFSEGVAESSFISRLVPLNQAFAYLFIYIILNNTFLCKQKIRMAYFIPIIIYFCNCVLLTSRTIFLRVIIFVLFIYLIMYRKTGNRGQMKTVIKVGVIAIIGYFFIFTVIGRNLGKGIYNTPLDVVQYYGGSSIYLLNDYINNPQTSPNTMFGEHTLYGIRNMLSIFFDSIEHISSPQLEYRFIPKWNSNLYTAFRRYIQDFGFLGLVCICNFLGIFYGKLRSNIKKNSNKMWREIFFAASIFPVVEIALEERFFMSYVSFSNFVFLIMLYGAFLFITRTSVGGRGHDVYERNK